MKLGQLQGTQEEITDFIQNNGLNVKDYFLMPDPTIKAVWLVIPAFLFFATFGVLTLLESLNAGQQKFVFLIGCAASVWLATVVHLRFKHTIATCIVVIGCLLIMLVGLGDMSPTQMYEEIKSFQNSKADSAR